MYQTILSAVRPNLEKTVDFFRKEMGKIRTGQATPSLVEDLPVTISGQAMALKQVAAISTSEMRTIVVQPWDTSYIKPIETALSTAELGASPVVDKDIIRITLPPMTQEFRDKLSKIVSEKAEEAKRSIRHAREEAWNAIQDGAKKGEVREDDKFRGKEELQKLTDEFTEKIEEVANRKREEISLK